jgi:hypothetical protein
MISQERRTGSPPVAFKEWLSGRCFFVDPPAWTYELAPGRVAIVPTWKPTVFVAVMFFFIVGFVPLLCWPHYRLRNFDDIAGMVFGVFAAVGAAGCGISLVGCLVNQFRGPYFILPTSDQTVSLPRDRLVIPRADLLGWRVVLGNWVGPEGAQKVVHYALGELQLVVKTIDGEVAYPIVAGRPQSVSKFAQEIAGLTLLPIEIVVQHQGVRERSVSKLRLFWRSGGM